MAQLVNLRRRRLKHGAAFLLAIVGLWLLCSCAVAYKLTRRAGRFAEPAPNVAGAQLQDLRLSTTDGEEIGGWFAPGQPGQPAVLLLHGNQACRSAVLPMIQMLVRNGFPVLAITQRAHGDSTGTHNDFGWSARHDVIAAVAWLHQHEPKRSIVIWGQSLGAASALFAAQELGERVGGYVLECPYENLRTAVHNRTNLYLPAVIDEIAYAGLLTVSPLVLDDIDQISPLLSAANVPKTVPVLVLAGGLDRHAKPNEARAIAECLDGHCQMIEFPNADHLQLSVVDEKAYQKVILGFMGQFSTVP